jgi:hypothetical protein
LDHLRWDLNAVFKMASDDAILKGNPAGSLVTPKGAAPAVKRALTIEEILSALSVFDLRERIVFLLAVVVGMRPGQSSPYDGRGYLTEELKLLNASTGECGAIRRRNEV